MKEDRRKEKRNRILDEAGKLFVANGIESTKIIDIAKAAGVAKGTVYEYFESKEDIVIEWMSGTFERFRSEMMEKMENEADAVSKLKVFFEYSADNFRNIMINAKVLLHEKGIEKYAKCPFKESIEDAVEDRIFILVIDNIKKMFDILNNIVHEGQSSNQFRDDINLEAAPFFMISMLPFLGLTHQPDFPASYVKEKFELTKLAWSGEEMVSYIVDGIGKKA